jgi:hypothetical protein
MKRLMDVIAEFQSEFKAGIPKIGELFTHSDSSIRYIAAYTIYILGEQGK